MIYENFKKYKYVREYDETFDIPQSLIESLLQKTWEVTPSKNNFMPYSVWIIGTDSQFYKDCVYRLCLEKECESDSRQELNDFIRERYTNNNIEPQFSNVQNCSYLLIFTQRFEDKLNPWQEFTFKNGRNFEQVDSVNPGRSLVGSSIEIGMFANTFGGLCLENNIDISHTLCHPHHSKAWQKYFPFIKNRVILIMTVGKGLRYRQETLGELENHDLKPDFDRIVKFI